MYDAPQPVLLAAAAAALLGLSGFRGVNGTPGQDDRDRVLCVAAMIQAACFGARQCLPTAVRARAIRSILNFDATSVEGALGGRLALRSGLRRYLRLVKVFVAKQREVVILETVADYVHTARHLRGRRGLAQREAFFTALRQAESLDPEGQAALLAASARLLATAPHLGRRRLQDDDAALAWLYGMRAAWLWCGAGGGRSPFFRVSRKSVAAARMLLGQTGDDETGW